MPYRRATYSRRRKFSRRRPGVRRTRFRRRAPMSTGMTWASAGVKALSIATRLAGIINSELKHYDETNTLTPDSATGTSTSIVRGMAQGLTNNTFDGNSILVKKVSFAVNLLMNASATTTRVRLVVALDTRPSTTLGTLPAWTDVFSANALNSLRNIDDQIKRFWILYDRVHIVNSVSLSEKTFMFTVPFNRHIKFTDAQVPNLNDIVVLAISDEATNTPTLGILSRLRYYDN